MSGEEGRANAACHRARVHYGMPPLAQGSIVPRSPPDDAFGCQAVD